MSARSPKVRKPPASVATSELEEELNWRTRLVAGIDEVGRGPLAGPVVAAAVVFENRCPDGLADSKTLSRTERERLFAEILDLGHVGVASLGAAEIDRINIRQASLEAMRRAALALPIVPDHALVDGRDVPPNLLCLGTAVIGGDGRSVSIAAASIVAKVVRDAMMTELGRAYPNYGFERHMGYGTAAHLDALREHGALPIHRRSFAPIRNLPA